MFFHHKCFVLFILEEVLSFCFKISVFSLVFFFHYIWLYVVLSIFVLHAKHWTCILFRVFVFFNIFYKHNIIIRYNYYHLFGVIHLYFSGRKPYLFFFHNFMTKTLDKIYLFLFNFNNFHF